jgi:hypothetical protein
MNVRAADAGKIDETCKEAVVDGILNNLGGRVSGGGEFHRMVYGIRPSSLLVSGFLVACPEEEREGDEEANPLQINAHGLDFHIDARQSHRTLKARLKGAVYLRIFPAREDIEPDGRLTPVFSLDYKVQKDLRTRMREARDALRAELGIERRKEHAHPDWLKRDAAICERIHAELGVTFDPARRVDATGEDNAAAASEPEESSELEDTGIAVSNVVTTGSDAAYKPMEPPQKWLRLELDLPPVEFSANTCEDDARRASDEINAAIQAQLSAWFLNSDPSTGGARLGYRRGAKIRPSNLRDWDRYVGEVCANDQRGAFPVFDIKWALSATPDPLHADRLLVHVGVENWTEKPTGLHDKEFERALFQVSVRVEMEHQVLRPLLLDRVKPSYRYNQYLRYPALGFNCGVKHESSATTDVLTTTWTPRYTLPRVVPTEIGAELRFSELATKPGLERLAPLVREYVTWLEETRRTRVDLGIEGPNAADQLSSERGQLDHDIKCWEREQKALERGLALLVESAEHWSGPGPQSDPKGIPCEAWFAMNEAMRSVGGGKYDSWRLFQLAFIVSMVPTFATRIPAFHANYTDDVAVQANAVTLLYFATGGGKSEAFLGLLLYVLLLDRLRGKERGVSALMRYPLRLLTLQQARRTMNVLAAGELQRVKRKYPGEPLSLGFWVGGTNTPNWHKNEGVSEVPTLDSCPLSEETEASKQSPYAELRKQWLKLETCPFCKSQVALRRAPKRTGGVLGHYCTAEKSKCGWNEQYPKPTPLPFYIVDEDIYALAPSVLLGTVDKLAVIGQSYRTIRFVFGMFGLAPFRHKPTGLLYTPMLRADWESAVSEGCEPLFPAYENGKKPFFDPFPSLLIQDEAHLLEESLGTFAGLFESALDAGFDRLAPLFKDQICREPNQDQRRRIKVIAASATVSEPQRQMRNLYQREVTIQFPHPGPDLYRSFYAVPKVPKSTSENAERLALSDIELRCHGARTYGAIVTNGHRHTVAMATILGQYHLLITELYEHLRSGDPARETVARQALRRWLSDSPLTRTHQRAIDTASAAELLTLVDLHRIALTYVTNKKGGDQVIDTERAEFETLHQEAGFEGQMLKTRLISGAVSASDIQAVVREAEQRVRAGELFPDLSDTLRSIIATSAVSHGVDVEEFNAMFFAGLPSDIAEYIQASSRVGRTHAGFSLLVPVPQRQRDRFVVEIFDIFHRFLERMVLPAAVDRWAEKAIRRVIPSVMQEYLCGISRICEIAGAPVSKKSEVRDFQRTEQVREHLAKVGHREELKQFVIDALGLAVRPPLDGLPYYEALVQKEISGYWKDMDVSTLRHTDFKNFFEQRDQSLRPMTSLRDVDLAGFISESRSDALGKKTEEGQTATAMNFIRRGVSGELDDEDDFVAKD